MNMEELNEIATLLHVTSEIATNHPQLAGIAKACRLRLAEIEADLKAAETAPKPLPPAELKAAQHTTGKLNLKKEDKEPGTTNNPKFSETEPTVERRV